MQYDGWAVLLLKLKCCFFNGDRDCVHSEMLVMLSR